jgi:hypothetical protein
MEMENIILREIRQVPKSKAAFFLSYVEYKLKTNTSNIISMYNMYPKVGKKKRRNERQ